MTIRQTCVICAVVKLSLPFFMGMLVYGCASMEEAGEAYRTDMTPLMERNATLMRAHSPSPIWQGMSLWPEIDEMLPGPGNGLFFAVRMFPAFMRP